MFSFVETRDSVASQKHARRQLLPAAAWQWHSAARAARAAGRSSIRQRQTPPGLRCAVSAFCPRIRSLGGGVHAAHVWAPASRAQRTAQHNTAACVPPAQKIHIQTPAYMQMCFSVHIEAPGSISRAPLSVATSVSLRAKIHADVLQCFFFFWVCADDRRASSAQHIW